VGGAEAGAKGVSRARALSPEELFWLRRCEGFRVEFEGGLIGYVDDVHFDHDEQAHSIGVRGSRNLGRVLTVSLAEVDRVHPEAERIELAHYPERELASFLADFADDLLRAAGKWRRPADERR
jgi:hypothetical protein